MALWKNPYVTRGSISSPIHSKPSKYSVTAHIVTSSPRFCEVPINGCQTRPGNVWCFHGVLRVNLTREEVWVAVFWTNVVDWGMIDMNRYDITTASQFRDSMSEKYFRHVVLVISYIHILHWCFSVWKYLRKQLSLNSSFNHKYWG